MTAAKRSLTSGGMVTTEQAMAERKGEYRAQLEAASPSNRFMRHRQGLGQTPAERYSEAAVWRVRQIFRHMADNDALPGMMCRRLADQVVQEGGFQPVPQTGDPALNLDLLQAFKDWASNPMAVDYYGRSNFASLQRKMVSQTAGDGELFANLLSDGKIQLIEADYCVTPKDAGENVVNGMRFVDGLPVSVFFSSSPMSSSYYGLAMSEAREYPIQVDGLRVLLHHYRPSSISQWRGASYFHPIMIKAGMLDDLDFATLVKQQNAAAVTALVKSNVPYDSGPQFGEQYSVDAGSGDSATVNREEKIQAGMIMRLYDEEEVSDFSPVLPSTNQMEHAIAIMRQMGSGATDTPYEILMLDGSITNFSGWKGAVDTARDSYRVMQGDLTNNFHYHVWRWFVRRQASILGATARRLLASGDLYRHKWTPPSWESVQRLTDASADLVLLDTNTASPRDIAARRGRDYTDVVAETVEDNANLIVAAIERAAEINTRYASTGMHVDWRDVARMGNPRGVNYSGLIDLENGGADQGASGGTGND